MAILTALGATVDAFLLSTRRKFIYHKMEDWWLFLIDARVPEIHKRVANKTAHLLGLIAGERKNPIRALLILIPFSYLWTMCWSLFGFIAGERATLARMHIDGSFTLAQSIESWFFGLTLNPVWAAYWLFLVPMNSAFFDLATLFCAIWFAQLVQTQSAIRALATLIANIGTSVLFSLIGFTVSVIIAQQLGVSLYSGSVLVNPIELPKVWTSFLGYAMNGAVALSAVTSLIPVSLYVLILILLLSYKFLGEIIRQAISKFLEAAVDRPVDKFAPFTLLGTVTGLLSSILKALVEFLKQ